MSNKIITMKKILLSLAVILVTAFYVNAQSFTLSWDGEMLGDTVIITPNSETGNELVLEAIFNNTTDNAATIKVIRNQIFVEDGAVDYFCWGACYPPAVDTSGVYLVIGANSSSGDADFSAHYEINEVVGVSIVEYTFYNIDNPDENVKVVAKFDTSPDGIDEYILNNMRVSEIYPNPATNFVNIDYDIPSEVNEASIKIVNILGSVVKEQEVNTGVNKVRMSISELVGGIYFYSLIINDEIYSTKKLIVR